MLQWFVDTLQRIVEAAFGLIGSLLEGFLRAPGVAAARATAPIDVRQGGPQEVVGVRHAVLRQGRPRETAVFEGDDEPDTMHWVAVQADRVVGVVTVLQRSPPEEDAPAWQLRGMAVLPELQGTGVGAALLAATHLEGRSMWCNARVAVVPFYERHGWQVVGERFEISGVGPHQQMRWSAGARG